MYNNNNKALVPNFLGSALNPQQDKLRMAMCILFLHSILSAVIAFVTSLIDTSFLTTANNVIFGLPLPFLVPST